MNLKSEVSIVENGDSHGRSRQIRKVYGETAGLLLCIPASGVAE